MAGIEHRVVYTNGTASYLMEGDPEQDHDRFFFMRGTGRLGCALPQLLGEGWVVESVTPVSRTTNENFGATLVVLMRASAEGRGERYGRQ